MTGKNGRAGARLPALLSLLPALAAASPLAAQPLLRVEVYPEARLYRDRDVVAALARGKVEMAVPGAWQLGGFEPAVGAWRPAPERSCRGAGWTWAPCTCSG